MPGYLDQASLHFQAEPFHGMESARKLLAWFPYMLSLDAVEIQFMLTELSMVKSQIRP